MKVAVIYNKKHTEEEDVVSLFGPLNKEYYSPKVIEKVAQSLEQFGHKVKVIEGNINVGEELKQFMPKVLAGDQQGMVFNMAYGIQGHSRYTHIPALLEMLGVPYVGSGPQAHAVALDKIMAKIIFKQNNLPTPDFWFFNSPNDDLTGVKYPVIVKPKMESTSMGLKVVDNDDDLRDAIQYVIDTFKQQALVESFIKGREFAVGLLGNEPNLEVFPPVEFALETPDAIQTKDTKMKKGIDKICPADLSEEKTLELQDLAKKAFNALDLKDFSRVDFRMDSDGNPYILEINSMASMGFGGSYVFEAKTVGYTYESLVNRMLEVAAVRNFGDNYLQSKSVGADDAEPVKNEPLRARVRSYVRSQFQTTKEFLKDIVDINSYVYDVEDVNYIGSLLSKRLTKMGFTCNISPHVEVGNTLYFTNHDGEKNDILILAQLDNSTHQSLEPFKEDRGKIFGTGVAENKGGIAITMSALQALRFNRKLKGIKCGILFVSDETIGGKFTKELVAKHSSSSKYVVGVGNGSLEGDVFTSCYGSLRYHVELSVLKDSSKVDQDIVSVVCKKISLLNKISKEFKDVSIKFTSVDAKCLEGLSSDFAAFDLYISYANKGDSDKLKDFVSETVKKDIGSKYKVKIKRTSFREPTNETSENKSLYEKVSKIAGRLELKISSSTSKRPLIISSIPNGIPTLGGFGPIGSGVKTRNEYIIKDSLIDKATLLALLINSSNKEE